LEPKKETIKSSPRTPFLRDPESGGIWPIEPAARHEAGHAVVAAVLRKRFRYVEIGFIARDDGVPTLGRVIWSPKCGRCNPEDNEERTRVICERNAIAYFAGPIAEGWEQGERNFGLYFAEKMTHHISRTRNKSRVNWKRLRDQASDIDKAARMIYHISRTRDALRANWERLWNQAEILVSDHRDSIEAVARELLVKRRLSYREVRKIIGA
jgi:hypothetical protein